MSKFLDRVLSDNPQLDFQEIYEYSLKDFLFSSGNDSRILLEYPNICREQLENAIVKIVDWVPDESGANNINVVVKIPAIFYIIPKTGKPKDIKQEFSKRISWMIIFSLWMENVTSLKKSAKRINLFVLVIRLFMILSL